MTAADTHRAIDAVWRIESARLIAGLARMVRDIGLAEDLAQDALVAALEQWPQEGVPRNPGAWLMAVAKRRAIDVIRRQERLGRKHEELGRAAEVAAARAAPEVGAAPDDDIGDDLLRLMFTACHPVLGRFDEAHEEFERGVAHPKQPRAHSAAAARRHLRARIGAAAEVRLRGPARSGVRWRARRAPPR